MNLNLSLFIIILFSSSTSAQIKSTIILKSLTDSFTYSEEGYRRKFPIVNGDTIAFGTNYYENVLKLNTEIDSVAAHFNPKRKPHKQTTLVHISSPNGKQVVYLNFNEAKCWLTNDYIKKALNEVQYDIPETYELANVIYALTNSSFSDSNRTFKDTDYYSRVLSYFNKYKSHPLITLTEFPSDAKGSMDYYNFRDNSFCFTIKKGKVVSNNQYYTVWGEQKTNLFAKQILLINDFYKKTNFHRFYQSNLSYYDFLTKRKQQLMPAKKMWNWLQKNFDQKIQSYRVVFSPLIKGSHGTQIFYWIPKPSGLFAEAVMFTSGTRGIDENINLTEKQKEGIASGILFTEIDHNYCNPVSMRYQKAIDSALSNREEWVASGGDADAYLSPIAVFNEYITHAMYILYAYDNFNETDFLLIKKDREDLMINHRKYIRFKEFADRLLKLYKTKQINQTVKGLFPLIIDWCKTQN